MTTMTTDPATKVEQLRSRLAELEAADLADPVTLAGADTASWAKRDQRRRDEKLEVSAEIARIGEYGSMLDDPAAMDAVGVYMRAVAEPRVALRHVVATGDFANGAMNGTPKKALETWLRELHQAARFIGVDINTDARRWFAAQLTEWANAREQLVAAYLSNLGHRNPVEMPALLGELPGGFRLAPVIGGAGGAA